MQYLELAVLSILVPAALCIPHLVTLLGLRALRKTSFQISLPDIILVSIVIGELAIIIPTATLGFVSAIQISHLFNLIIILSIAISLVVVVIYFLRTWNSNVGKSIEQGLQDQVIHTEPIAKYHPSSRSSNLADIITTSTEHRRPVLNSKKIVEEMRTTITRPEVIFIIGLLTFFSYLVLVIPVELSYDATNYYLPYSQGLLKNGFIPSDPFTSYLTLGGQPTFPPGISSIYAYAMNLVPVADSFKLMPVLFVIHISLSIALLAREIYPRIRASWVAIIFLISPPVFFFLVTAPYNPDMLFSALFVTSILYVIRAKMSPLTGKNILWPILAGASVSGMILTKDVGLLFLLPILSLALLGNRRLGILWLAPMALQIMVPMSFLLNTTLSNYYVEHSLSLIIVQIASLTVLWIISRSFHARHSMNLAPFFVMLLPAMIFLVINTTIWGSPITRTYTGFFTTPNASIDYPWATDIAQRELGINAFPIQPLTSFEILMNLVYVFFAPALGGLLLVPKILGVLGISWTNRETNRILSVLCASVLIIVTMNWLAAFAGIDYSDHSTLRRTLDLTAVFSILAAIGMFAIISRHRWSGSFVFLLLVTAVFTIYLLTYFKYNASLFSLQSRVLTDEPFVIFSIISAAIFIPALLLRKKDSFRLLERFRVRFLLKGAVIAILLLAVQPYFVGTMQVMAQNDYSYENTARHNLSTMSFGKKMLDIQDYFNTQTVDGRILAYGIDWLSYRTGEDVLEMRTIISLAALKNTLTGNQTSAVVENLDELDVEYIVAPVSGDTSIRLRALYNDTRLFEVLTDEYTTKVATFDNIVIYRLK